MKLFVKDTDGSGRLDGLPHIPWGLGAGILVATFASVFMWYGAIGVAGVFTALELKQEYDIQKKGESKNTWKDRLPHRFQDVWFTVAGYFAGFYATFYLIKVFM